MRLIRHSTDGRAVRLFDLSNSMFVTKNLGGEGFSFRQEIMPLIDELMTYLLKNEVPTELKKFSLKISLRPQCQIPLFWTNRYSNIVE